MNDCRKTHFVGSLPPDLDSPIIATPATVPRSTAGVVALANAIARYRPTGRHFDFVHLPMADGPRPPLEPDYYTHLGRLSLPAETRIVAGISHAHQSLDVQRQALDLAEDAIGHTLDIAAPCGLGRYPDADTARAMMKHSVTLAQRNWLGHPDRPHRLRRLLTRRLVPDLLT